MKIHKDSAYVSFKSQEELEAGIQKLSGSKYKGNALVVKRAADEVAIKKVIFRYWLMVGTLLKLEEALDCAIKKL